MEKIKKARLFELRSLPYDFTIITGCPAFLWYRPKRIYISKAAKKKVKGGLILISNHISLKDPVYLAVGYPFRRHNYVATKELFCTKGRKWFFGKVMRIIEIDRDNFSISSFKEIVKRLKEGRMVSLFPEGHVNTNKDGKLNEFHSGMVMMAIKGNAPILPIFIKKKPKFGSRLIVGIGEPINVNDYKSGPVPTIEDIEKISKMLEEQTKELEKLCNTERKKKNETSK